MNIGFNWFTRTGHKNKGRRWLYVTLENRYKACVHYRGKPFFCMVLKIVLRDEKTMLENVSAHRIQIGRRVFTQ